MDVDVKVVAGATGILANQAVGVGLVDGGLENGSLVVELTADVNVGSGGIHAAAGKQAALDKLVGVLANNLSVLAGTGLTLISVDNEVSGAGVLVPAGRVHEGPLEAGRETGTTSASETRLLHLADDPIVALEDDFLGLVPVAHSLGVLEVVAVVAVDILENAVLVTETAVLSGRRIVADGSGKRSSL